MRFHEKLYVGQSIPHVQHVRHLLRIGVGQFHIFLITTAKNSDQLDIFDSKYLKDKKHYDRKNLQIAGIAGSMADAFYGVSKRMINECFRRLPEDILLIMQIFYTNYYLIKIVCFNKNKLCDGIPEPDCGGLPGPKIINETGLK